MLKVFVNSIPLDLPDNADIAFEFNNSALFDDYVVGSGSYDITFPSTPNNRKAFSHAHRMDSAGGARKYVCKVEYGVNTLFVGELIIWEIKGGQFKATIEQTSVRSLIQNVKITDLNYSIIEMGTTTQDVQDYMKSTISGNTPVKFPIFYAPNFYENSETWKALLTVNDYDPDSGEYLTWINGTTSRLYHPIVPVVLWKTILDQIIDDYGMRAIGDGFQIPELNNGFFLNNRSLDLRGGSYLVNKQLVSIDCDPIGDLLDGETFSATKTGLHRLTFTADWPAWSSLQYIKIGLMANTGSQWEFVASEYFGFPPNGQPEITFDYEITDTNEVYLIAAEAGDVAGTFILENTNLNFWNFENTYKNVYEKSINPKNHLPDITISTFLQGLKNIFGLQINFIDEQRLFKMERRINLLINKPTQIAVLDRDSILIELNDNVGFDISYEEAKELELAGEDLGAVDYYSDLPVPSDQNHYIFVTQTNAYYKTVFDEDTSVFSWELIGNKVDQVVEGEGDVTEILLMGVPATMHVTPKGRYCPVLSDAGVSSIFEQFEKTEIKQMAIWKGLQNANITEDNPSGNQVPLATSLPNTETALNAFDFGLNLTGSNNLYDILHSDWFKTKVKSDTITLEINGKHIDVDHMMNNRLYWDGILMILEQLTLSYNNKKRPKAKLKCLKVNH